MGPLTGGLIIGAIVGIVKIIKGDDDKKGKGNEGGKGKEKDSDYDSSCNCSIDQN